MNFIPVRNVAKRLILPLAVGGLTLGSATYLNREPYNYEYETSDNIEYIKNHSVYDYMTNCPNASMSLIALSTILGLAGLTVAYKGDEQYNKEYIYEEPKDNNDKIEIPQKIYDFIMGKNDINLSKNELNDIIKLCNNRIGYVSNKLELLANNSDEQSDIENLNYFKNKYIESIKRCEAKIKFIYRPQIDIKIQNKSEGLSSRKLSGQINNSKYNLIADNNSIKGNFDDKNVELNISSKDGDQIINGNIGDKTLTLKITPNTLLSNQHIIGNFNGKDFDIEISNIIGNYRLENKNKSIDLKIDNETIFGNKMQLHGAYDGDYELIPILVNIVCNARNKAIAVLYMN